MDVYSDGKIKVYENNKAVKDLRQYDFNTNDCT
jgi:hypothetical protein